jgi:hypothetical protein
VVHRRVRLIVDRCHGTDPICWMSRLQASNECWAASTPLCGGWHADWRRPPEALHIYRERAQVMMEQTRLREGPRRSFWVAGVSLR